ncbi:hypothetical protein SEA_COLUCCI_28 [Arthrobacter phage Colucci]|uniref:Uncharacterized protein n=1 Tax=Arthrobacter phage Colucci TaxID=2015834 RepID=A0A286N2U2_9CAUD|nr:hypothetical protein FDI27_gp028 [Arthrobacter phage Colucci]ASX98699.1 hypothetical protein SEA_COLUCCI_28 [Arthrobacter phage Colucci]
MNALLSKLFGWQKYTVSPEEKLATTAAMTEAQQVKKEVEALQSESSTVGARQRHIREENNWTRSLEHVFRGAQ